jgi:peptidoglycan/LPS O-acetylase OafA/YrhL
VAWPRCGWSEWAAYLLFPFLVVAIGLLRDCRLAFCLALVSLLALTLSLSVKESHTLNHAGPPGIVRCLFEFSAGALAWKSIPADVWKAVSAEDSNYRRLGEVCMALGAVVLVLAHALTTLQVIAPFAFLMFILGCALPSWTAGRLSGNISFSVYLVHIFVLGCLTAAIDSVHINTGDWLPRLGASAAYLPLVLVTAYLTCRFVERPTHEFARRHGHEFTSRTLAWFGLGRSLA